MGKSTISMAIFNSYVTKYQRVIIDALSWLEIYRKIVVFPNQFGVCWIDSPFFIKPLIDGSKAKYLLVLNVGNGWVAGGCWDDYY